jgi:hypothetical protein
MFIGSAFAQDGVTVPEINAQNWRLPVDSQATLWTNDSGIAPSGPIGRFGLSYVNTASGVRSRTDR